MSCATCCRSATITCDAVGRRDDDKALMKRYRWKTEIITIGIPNRDTFRKNVISFLYFLDACPAVREFLNYDRSFMLADKYLIAMVFIYFQRAGIRPWRYTRLQFFAALCLAHSMEEENRALLYEIYSCAFGQRNSELVPHLVEMKLYLWKAIDYRAFVNKKICQQVMSVWPYHSAWKRKRASICQSSPIWERRSRI